MGTPNLNYLTSSTNATKVAKERGWKVVSSSPNRLLLDIDRKKFNPATDRRFKTIMPLLEQHLGAKIIDVSNSKSGNWHVIISLNQPLKVSDRIALQAALGSDAKREVFSVLRIHILGEKEPSLLFRKDG